MLNTQAAVKSLQARQKRFPRPEGMEWVQRELIFVHNVNVAVPSPRGWSSVDINRAHGIKMDKVLLIFRTQAVQVNVFLFINTVSSS